jgi:hypothetical protein
MNAIFFLLILSIRKGFQTKKLEFGLYIFTYKLTIESSIFEGGEIELRHQRNPDVVEGFVYYDKGKRKNSIKNFCLY